MSSGISKAFKKFNDNAFDGYLDPVQVATKGEMGSLDVSNPNLKVQHRQLKKQYENITGKTEEDEQVRAAEAAALANGPNARGTQGVGGTNQMQGRKGSSSTRKIKRTPLGGGASLT